MGTKRWVMRAIVSDYGKEGGHGGANLSLQLFGELEVRLGQHELQKEGNHASKGWRKEGGEESKVGRRKQPRSLHQSPH